MNISRHIPPSEAWLGTQRTEEHKLYSCFVLSFGVIFPVSTLPILYAANELRRNGLRLGGGIELVPDSKSEWIISAVARPGDAYDEERIH